jgi:hypothetical protein
VDASAPALRQNQPSSRIDPVRVLSALTTPDNDAIVACWTGCANNEEKVLAEQADVEDVGAVELAMDVQWDTMLKLCCMSRTSCRGIAA